MQMMYCNIISIACMNSLTELIHKTVSHRPYTSAASMEKNVTDIELGILENRFITNRELENKISSKKRIIKIQVMCLNYN